MKVVLCYKEFELGELTVDNDEYVFNTVSGSELAKQKYAIPRACALLVGGEKRSKKLYPEFAYFFNLLKNSYIKSEANIVDGESEYEMLVKIARLYLDRGSFYLKLRK